MELKSNGISLVKWEKVKENRRTYFIKKRTLAGKKLTIRAFTEEGKDKYFLLNFSITPFPLEFLKQVIKEVREHFDVNYAFKENTMDFWIINPYETPFSSLGKIEEKVLNCLKSLYLEYLVPSTALEKITSFLRKRGWITSPEEASISAMKILRRNKSIAFLKLTLILQNNRAKIMANATVLTRYSQNLRTALRFLSRKYRVSQNEVFLSCTINIVDFEDIIKILESDIERALKVLPT